MSVWYLELDDEITDAVARLRAAKDERVVFVVPAGSRIGTGRINFRLLAREAVSRGLGIALVSGDPQVRALAASAGLPTYASVGESERGAATEGPLKQDAVDGTPAAEGTGATATITTAPGPGAGVRTAGSRPVRRPRSRRRVMAMTVGGLALVGVVGGGALLALYQSVPTARILLALAPRAFPPRVIALSVSASEPTSAETGTIQGQLARVTVPGSVQVIATERVDLSNSARGTVTFTNGGQVPVAIPERTVVATPDGIAFQTLQVVPAVPVGGTADVEVWALEQGQEGNVPAGSITVIPQDAALAAQLGSGGVINAEPTTGGQTGDQMRFSQEDYDDAVRRLTADLTARLRDAVPEVDEDTIAYPGTAQQASEVIVEQPAAAVVGAVGPEATLTGSLQANVLTASRSQVEAVARQMLATAVAPAHLVPGSVIELGDPTITDDRATYRASAIGLVYGLTIEESDLKDQVRNKTIEQAQDILSRYGTATITLSPDFLPSLPDDPNRIEISLASPEPGATPVPMTSPSASPVVSPSPAGSPAPVASSAPSASPSPAAGVSPRRSAALEARIA
jgi:hypothetical protein